MTLTARFSLLFVVALAACSSTVTGPSNDASVDAPSDALDAPGDAPSDYCTLPNGARCARGSTCPAGDGCNVCSCGPGLIPACTLRACPPPPPDGGARSCSSRADCGRGEECQFPTTGCSTAGTCQPAILCDDPTPFCGCDGSTYFSCTADRPTRDNAPCPSLDAGTPGECLQDRDCNTGMGFVCQFSAPGCGIAGRCGSARDCAFITEYCGCDRVTFRDCPGGTTSRPYLGLGACSVIDDAGVAPRCAGAHFSGDGRSCIDAAGNPLSHDCCSWNCNTNTAACESLPPRCEPGFVNSVVGACWGPCVHSSACAPMRCDTSDCPTSWRCDPSTRLCVYTG